MNFTEVLIPIVVSGVMPVAIVALIARIYIKKSEHRMNVMVKAIENGAELDQNALMGPPTMYLKAWTLDTLAL